MNNWERKVLEILNVSDYEKDLYERFYFSFPQKLKYYFSKQFRDELGDLIFQYDFQEEIYDKNQRFFAEIEKSIDVILGRLDLEEALETIRRIQKRRGERKRPETYRRLLNSLNDANEFYNSWNDESNTKYKNINCKRLLLDLDLRFKEGAQYVVLLKLDGQTSLLNLEKQISRNLDMSDKTMGLVFENMILPEDYYINMEVDGMIFKRGCPLMNIFTAIFDGFSYLPVTKLAIISY